MTFSNIYLTLFLLLIGTGVLQAQIQVCDLQSDSDDVTIEYNIASEVENGDGTCDYLLSITISADDGDADTDIVVDASVSIDAPFNETIQRTLTLSAGNSSQTFPMNPNPITFPCGQTGTFSSSIVGTTSACSDVPVQLPVELTAFNLSYTDGATVALTWETASEIENMGFEVQRSQDAYKWETLTFVKGNYTTLEAQRYEWIDTKPLIQSISYYRLKQMDTDGTYAYSDILVAKGKQLDGKVDVFPNPSTDFVNITLPSETVQATIEIYSLSNQLMTSITKSTDSGILNVNISDLAKGSYYLIVRTESDQFVEKLVKQ
jgi:hypothetical protein